MRKTLATYFLLLFSATMLLAQGTSVASGIPYVCSFEESEDLSAWTLNYNTPTATDQWIFGTAEHSEGKRSMYVSTDGSSPIFGAKPNVVVAYLRYKFPTASSTQKYEVSFDWKGMGDSTSSKLRVLFCREQDLTATGATNLNSIVSATSGRISNQSATACQNLGESEEKFVCGGTTWQNVSFSGEVSVSATNSSKNFVFVFIWENSNTQSSVVTTSIAIDNFQITSAAIKKPENVRAYPNCEDTTILVTWDGKNATEFDIQYRKVGETAWAKGISGIAEGMERFVKNGSTCSYGLSLVHEGKYEGSYDIRIRGKNDGLSTNYVYVHNILVYCPENHCINYVDLYSPNVTCTYGHYPSGSASPYENTGIVDFGPEEKMSRHTLHVNPDELDPRTNNQLHTVPEGALASVRLGNWNNGSEAESITYDLLVDSANQGILIIKYAVVLEEPGHDEEPEFVMRVLDKDGNLIDSDCGQAHFSYSQAQGIGWHTEEIPDPNYGGTTTVAWKDWTTVGVNLMQYDGQHIKVQFITMDCNWSGHFGYAYFTLDCVNAHIETENCGNDPYLTCIAPDGFSYAWRDETGADHGTDQVLHVDAGLHTYTCKVSFIEDSKCFFEISTISAPRFPVPEFSFEPIYDNCTSKLKFTNTSHVMNKFDGYDTHTTERCSESKWSFRRLSNGETKTSSAWAPTYLCPEEGDSIEVTITTYIGANNSCDSTRVDTIVVPNIVPRDSVTHIKTCPENPIQFDGKWFETDTVYKVVTPNFAGCDSTSTLYLKVYPKPQDHYRHDSICSDQSVTINGVRYNQSVENYPIIMQTPYGCDSVLYLTLTVNERLQSTLDPLASACADDEELFILLDIQAGVFDSLHIAFSTPELHDTVIYDSSVGTVAIPYSADITPGHYSATLTFYQFCCGTTRQTQDIDIHYRSSIVEQKWNDVLTLLSPTYNGGYRFSAFRWFKNGQLIEGENHSYLYQPLDFDATYYVELTREDGVVITSCPMQPVYHEQQGEFPTIVQAGQHMPIYMEQPATIWYYTISGQLYSTFDLPQGYTTLYVPNQTGVYILKSANAQGETQAQVMIVQ